MNNKLIKLYPNRLSADLPQTYKLSEEQHKFYKDNGYLVIKELIDFSSLYSYKQRFIQICKGLIDSPVTVVKESGLIGKNLKPEDYINKVQELLYDDVFITYGEYPRMLDILSQLIGDDITAVNSIFINKPPGSGRHPPHQDLFYFPFRPADKIIGTWTAVDHVYHDNGCLYLIPGSHKAETLYPHGDVPDAGKLYHGILDENTHAPVGERVYMEMSPGDTIFFHPYLVHGSGPNITKSYRKAITFHFANSSCEYIDITGTMQEVAAKDIVKALHNKGFQGVTYKNETFLLPLIHSEVCHKDSVESSSKTAAILLRTLKC